MACVWVAVTGQIVAFCDAVARLDAAEVLRLQALVESPSKVLACVRVALWDTLKLGVFWFFPGHLTITPRR